MFIVIALVVLAIWALVATIIELRRDGYRRLPTDWRRVPARDALDGADPGHVYH